MIKLRDFKRALLALYIALLAGQTQEYEKGSNQQKTKPSFRVARAIGTRELSSPLLSV